MREQLVILLAEDFAKNGFRQGVADLLIAGAMLGYAFGHAEAQAEVAQDWEEPTVVVGL